MKRLFNLALFLILTSNLFGGLLPKLFSFRKPVAVNATTWKFVYIAPGVDAIVTVTGSKNATINMIDDSASYAYAWQPNIKYTNTMSSNGDSSYVEFTIKFVNHITGLTDIQDMVAMTLIDVDGNGTFREMVKTSRPATSSGISGSLITTSQDSKWLTAFGSVTDFVGIDTSVYKAMTQINFTNVSSYIIRVGVLGKVTGGTTRQHSLYFKPFNAMSVPLPVGLNFFSSKLNDDNAELTWATSSEENLNHFEICRSTDGHNFNTIGRVDASNNSNELIDYSFTDIEAGKMNNPVFYYRLKMVDNQGNFKFSNITQIRIQTLSTSANINVFPNPTTEMVSLKLASAPTSDITVVIIDAKGQIVLNYFNPDIASDNSMMFDVRNLENGVYYINILNNDGSITSNKFIKR